MSGHIIYPELQWEYYTIIIWCGPDCVLQEDTFGWRKDETIKMTFQYIYNPALWAGLELYGIILPWIVFLGLILTIILPITGKVTMQPGFTTIVIIVQFQF